jgi:dGTPase
MPNQFYQDFDLKRFPDPIATSNSDEYRSAFEIERDRIIFSYPFRRLQSKTQVFQSGEYDFYRTRLTHSIEVAKIGRSICGYLRARSPLLRDDFFIDADLTEAVGLAHDLGHPPFGHIGERKLNEMMQPYGGFEGNGQTLRILSELIYDRPDGTSGMNPSRAFLDGVMKYKALFSECIQTSENGTICYPEHHFIYDDQQQWRQQALGVKAQNSDFTPRDWNAAKSIECQIMDWADDSAYGFNDVIDGIHARYITLASLEDWAQRQSDLDEQGQKLCNKLLAAIRDGSFERRLSARIGRCVQAVSLEEVTTPFSQHTHRHAFRLVIDPEMLHQIALFKRIAVDLIFQSAQIQQIEFKGGFILTRLFNAMAENYGDPTRPPGLHLLPPAAEHLLLSENSVNGRFRRICDALAALTDGQAIRTYKRLFDPEFGSITELF